MGAERGVSSVRLYRVRRHFIPPQLPFNQAVVTQVQKGDSLLAGLRSSAEGGRLFLAWQTGGIWHCSITIQPY